MGSNLLDALTLCPIILAIEEPLEGAKDKDIKPPLSRVKESLVMSKQHTKATKTLKSQTVINQTGPWGGKMSWRTLKG